MFLFDVGEEGRVAEIVLAAGADIGSLFAILLLAVDHWFSAKLILIIWNEFIIEKLFIKILLIIFMLGVPHIFLNYFNLIILIILTIEIFFILPVILNFLLST